MIWNEFCVLPRSVPRKHTIAVPAAYHIPRSSDCLPDFTDAYPPFELEAHSQVPRHDPAPLGFGDLHGKPIQCLFRDRLPPPQVLNAATELPILISDVKAASSKAEPSSVLSNL